MAFFSSTLVKEKPKKKSSFLMVLIIFIFLLIGGAYIAFTMTPLKDKVSLYSCYWNNSLSSTSYGQSGQVIPVTIDEGSSIIDMGNRLQEKGVIKEASAFYCYVKKIDAGNKLQAGYYEVTMPITLEQLVPYLQEAHIPTVRITIPEGLRMDEIATKLDTAFGGSENSIRKFNKQDFLTLVSSKEVVDTLTFTKGKTSLEGFLFPDTYEFPKNASARDVIDLLTATFLKRAGNTNLGVSSEMTPYQFVTLASIIEKESGSNYEEKQVISGILTKRLKSGWLLEVDATFLYEKKNWKATITAADKASNTPYNTYIRVGLPPTPICNPGLESIQAALSPKSTDYWFYLHGNDGKVHYGVTYNDHLRNIQLYLQ